MAVVLTWSEGVAVSGTKVEVESLDLHVEFQPQDDVLCAVDHALRQCNGVKLASDVISTGGRLTNVQATKFDFIGDFNYLIYTSRNKFTKTSIDKVKAQQLTAQLKIYSPRHSHAVYEADLPFDLGEDSSKFWIGFCVRGGQGINDLGVTVGDPQALSDKKPSVYRDCVVDPEQTTIGISQPMNLEARQINPDYVEISWEEPSTDGGASISHYRLFI
mmetsp:Transcript_30501/g.46748  ORF Transcript_30501/g.46748 Transcript_30501/m.46748 type:complete len:217 (+) Transcript_30501:1171-1821(+)